MPALLQLASYQSDHRWNHASVRAGQYLELDPRVPLLPLLGEPASLGGVDVDGYRNDFAAQLQSGKVTADLRPSGPPAKYTFGRFATTPRSQSTSA